MMAASELTNLAGCIVIASLWQGVLLTMLAALGLRLAPRLSAASRFGLWMMTIVAIVALPLLSTLGNESASAGTARRALHLAPVWGFAMAACWLLLVLYRLVELLVGARHLIRTARDARPIALDPSIAALVEASARSVQVCATSAVDAPCIAGFAAARLLLPDSLVASLGSSDLHAIVLHELEHLRRRDDWFNLFSKVAIAVFPFNPALLWLDRRLGIERELACDASVVATTHLPLPYAGSLTRLAEHRVARRLALALAAWTRPSEVAQRVSALLGPPAPVCPRRSRTAIGVLSSLLLLTTFGLLRTPQIVSFAGADAGNSSVAMANGTSFAGRPAGDRWVALPTALRTALPSESDAVRSVPTRLTARHSAPAPMRISASVNSLMAPRVVPAPRALLTLAMRPAHATVRARRVRGTRAATRLLETDFPAFAAVPFGDGWLIVQL